MSKQQKKSKKRIRERIDTSGGIRWVTGASRKEIEERKREIIEANYRKFISESSMDIPLFQPYAEGYIIRYKQRKIAANTLVGYNGYLNNHLIPAFGKFQLDRITVNSVQDFMLHEADKGCAKATIDKMMQLLSQIMDSAVEDEFILRNPCKSKRLYNPSAKQKKVKAYPPGLYKRIEGLLTLVSHENDRLYLGLCLYTGLRQGEIVALRWEDVDFPAGFIHVQHTIQYAGKNVGTLKTPKTENGFRDVPIMQQLKTLLLQFQKPEGFILGGQRQAGQDMLMTHQAVKNMDMRINDLLKANGIKEPFYSHRMRHTVLTLLNNSRLADDKSLQAWAGHQDAAFTRRQYMNSQEEQMQQVGNAFSEYISTLL